MSLFAASDGSLAANGLGAETKAPSAKKLANPTNTIFILDASGSMWGQIKGTPKISIAKEVMAKLVPELPQNSRVGLIAYGHRRKGDCGDVETLVALGPDNQQAVLDAVKGLNAKGKTPLTSSVEQAFRMLQQEPDSATVILVSDGIESCNANPCKAVAAAKEAGIKFILHTVGFGLSQGESAQLQCMADAGGGQYFAANDADQLLKSARKAVQPAGGLKVSATLNGTPGDILLRVVDAATGKVVHENILPQPSGLNMSLAEGVYDIYVRPGGVSGAAERKLAGIQIKTGETVEKSLSFDKGRLKLSVTIDGVAVHALVHVEDPATHAWIYQSSTFGTDTPVTLDIAAGPIDIEVQAGADGQLPQRVEGVEILAGQTIEKTIPILAPSLAPSLAADANGMEQNVDRPGGGFLRQFNPATDDPTLCQQACLDDEDCHAWTYVKPNTIQGPSPNCWLKPEISPPVPNNCCISGTK